MKPTKKIFFLFLFLLLFNAIYNVSHLFLSNFNTKTPFIGKKVRFGPIVQQIFSDHLFLIGPSPCAVSNLTVQN